MIRAGLRELRPLPEGGDPAQPVRAWCTHLILRMLLAARSSDAAPIIRHAAFCATALAAWVFRFEIRAGNDLLWAIAAAAAANLTAQIIASRPALRRIGLWLSAAGGVAGWSLLAWMTGGIASPFLAGYALEIVLAAFSLPAAGVAAVTLGSVAALGSLQALRPITGAFGPLILHGAVLLVLGGAMILMLRRFRRAGENLSAEHARLRERMRALEEEIGAERAVGRVGENAARMAHGLKSAMHGLRGFGALIEEQAGSRRERPSALEGLRVAIDEVEALARRILRSPEAAPCAPEGAGCEAVGRAIDQAARAVGRTHPDLRWNRPAPHSIPTADFSERDRREVLEILFRNAAEAMGGAGLIAVDTALHAEWIQIVVRDEGPGFLPGALAMPARPGFTTKPEGSGFGLFLARRLLESRGARLEAPAQPGPGAEFRVCLPVSAAWVRTGVT